MVRTVTQIWVINLTPSTPWSSSTAGKWPCTVNDKCIRNNIKLWIAISKERQSVTRPGVQHCWHSCSPSRRLQNKIASYVKGKNITYFRHTSNCYRLQTWRRVYFKIIIIIIIIIIIVIYHLYARNIQTMLLWCVMLQLFCSYNTWHM
jgi:hypothetical protein